MARLRIAALVSSALLLAQPPARAADHSSAFLDAMRDRGHFELALDYIELADKDPLTPPGFKSRIGYERAVTLLGQAQLLTSSRAREAAIDAARRDLETYIAGNNTPRLAAEASMKLAAALRHNALRDISRSEREGSEQRSKLLRSARQTFKDARSFYTKAEKLLGDALEPLASVQPDSKEADQRLELRFQLAQCRLNNTSTYAALARTYKAGSKQYKKQLEEAAKQFSELAQKYDTQQSAGVGYYAMLSEGRCYLELGEHRLADGCFEVLISLPPESPSFRRLITQGYALFTESLVQQEKFADALEQAKRWLNSLERDEQNLPEVLSLKYQQAEAARLAAEKAKSEDKAHDLKKRARDWYAAAARAANEHQADARLKLVEINASTGSSPIEPATFAEARQLGGVAWDSMAAAKLAMQTGAGQNNKDLAEQEQQGRTDALTAYHVALRLVEPDTPLEQINDIRSRLSRLYYEAEDYFRCAAISEFIVTKHPSDPSAEDAARLAMVSFDRLYNQAREAGTDTSFASDELVRLSKFVTRRWAGKPLADTAFGVLLSAAIRDNRLEDARAVLKEVAPDRRAPLELKLAIANWGQATRPDASAEQKQQAAELLAKAVEQNRSQRVVTSAMATAALYLAQARLSGGDADAALALLTDKKLGPLTLVRKKSAAVDRDGFSSETYRTALQAYLAAEPPSISDAMEMMGLLEKEVGDPAALTRTYFAIGVRLQKQIDELNEAGKKAEAMRVGKAFAEIVGRIAGDVGDWTMQQWMAQTFLRLGEALSGSPSDEEERTKLLQQAKAGFEKLLELASKDPSSPPKPTSVLAVRMQLGNVLRQLGEHEQAIDLFAEILAEREAMLEVQKSAAYTYQEWGEAGDSKHLLSAIRGGKPSAKSGENMIWGWSKMARVAGSLTRRKPEYRDLFFESWLNVATSRYLIASKSAGADKKKNLASAQKTVLSLSRQYEDMGGPRREQQFDALYKQIQEAQGQKPTGLKKP